jgi:four helix bundle protein
LALAKHFRELEVYRRAFDAAMRIFRLSSRWPAEERYSLVDQVRRSSRSVCGNVAEAWRKRRYPAHFASKLSDANAEVAETQNWLEFAAACGYLSPEDRSSLWDEYERIAGGLVRMITDADQWCGVSDRVREDLATYDPSAPGS